MKGWSMVIHEPHKKGSHATYDFDWTCDMPFLIWDAFCSSASPLCSRVTVCHGINSYPWSSCRELFQNVRCTLQELLGSNLPMLTRSYKWVLLPLFWWWKFRKVSLAIGSWGLGSRCICWKQWQLDMEHPNRNPAQPGCHISRCSRNQGELDWMSYDAIQFHQSWLFSLRLDVDFHHVSSSFRSCLICGFCHPMPAAKNSCSTVGNYGKHDEVMRTLPYTACLPEKLLFTVRTRWTRWIDSPACYRHLHFLRYDR